MIKQKKLKTKSKSIYGKGIYDKAVNFLLNPDKKLKDGEKHVIMYDSKKKKFTPASYSGPGTDIISRLKQNIEPINKSDKTAQAHDIRYSLANNIENIKEADNKMVDKLKSLRKNKEESTFNTLPSQLGIQANQLLAKILPDKYFDKFVQYMTGQKEFRQNLKPEDRLLLQNKLKELEREGYGKIKRKRNKKK